MIVKRPMNTRLLWTWLSILGVGFALPAHAQPAAPNSQAEWLEIRVDMVSVATQRKRDAGPWDAPSAKEASPKDLCGLVALLGNFAGAGPASGAALGSACTILAPRGRQRQRDPRAPDLILQLRIGPDLSYVTPIVADTYAYAFGYPFVVPVDRIPRAGLQIVAYDADGGGEGEALGSFRLFKSDLLKTAGSKRPVRSLRDGAVERLEIVVLPYAGKVRKAVTEVSAAEIKEVVGVPVRTGDVVEIRARGKYEVTSALFKDWIHQDGYTKGHRSYNRAELPKARHGAAMALLGDAGFGVLVGNCVRIVSPFSGKIRVGVNDSDLANNSGNLKFSVVARQDPALWQQPGKVLSCPSRTKASIEPISQPESIGTGKSNIVAQVLGQRYLQGIQRCHQRVLLKDSTAGGRLNIEITIAPTGRVSKSTVSSFNSEVSECVRRLSRSWRFPPSTAGAYSVPFVLKPTG